jgi:nucleotide-binding universal stress UspA family protein
MSIFPTKILLATDGSGEADLALTTAADLAEKTGSELHVAYVFPTAVQRPFPNPITARPPEVQERELEEAMNQAQQFLDQQAQRARGEGVEVAETHLVRGRADSEIVHLSEEVGAGLIVMGSRGLGGVRRALMGSVSDSVVRHAHCPVLIVRE